MIAEAVDDGATALIFHPKTRGECGSIEMGELRKDGIYTSQGEEGYYINLTPATEKYYRSMVEAAGFEIPKKLVLSTPELEAPRSRPRVR